MRAGANTDALFFATHRDMSDLLIFVQEIDELKHVDVRNTGHQVDARLFQAGENLSRPLNCSHLDTTSIEIKNFCAQGYLRAAQKTSEARRAVFA